jgi:hypothetical protein
MTDRFNAVREKDHTVLTCIKSGENDVQQITAATTLSNSEVNYSFTKLADLGLITVEKPDGMVDRVIDGERQVFEAPKQAYLTDDALDYFDWTDREAELAAYRAMTQDELAERVHALEGQVSDLEDAFEAFRKQVREKLD